MATAVASSFHNQLAVHNIDHVEFNKQIDNKLDKAPVAPPSPDGAGADMPHTSEQEAQIKELPSLSEAPVLEVVDSRPTLPVPSLASRKARADNKEAHAAETRKQSIRRLASRAFEKQTGKVFTGEEMSAKEWEIYNAAVKDSEAIMDRKKADDEMADQLANNIKNRENLLIQLTNELGRKVELYQMGQDELAKATADFEAALKEHVATLPQPTEEVKSSSARMAEERQKKALKAQWREANTEDPINKARQRQFAAAEEIAALKARIEEVRKETGRMMGQAQKGKSSAQRMRDEKQKKEQMRASGASVTPREQGPTKVYVKREPEQRSHKQRMADEQARKAEARRKARMSLDPHSLVGPSSSTSSSTTAC